MRYEDGYWHKLVLQELKRMIVRGTLHAIGPMPQEPTRYNYLEGAEQEHEALTYLERMKVFQTDLGGIDEDEPWLFGVDIDKFEKLEKFGLKDVGATLELAKAIPVLPPAKLDTRSYNPKTGVLHFRGTIIEIIKQKNRLGTKNEPMQAHALRLLFSSVNGLRDGVPLRKIVNTTPVTIGDLKPNQLKQAKNHIAAINKKVKEVNDGPSLIKTTKHKFYIDEVHL